MRCLHRFQPNQRDRVGVLHRTFNVRSLQRLRSGPRENQDRNTKEGGDDVYDILERIIAENQNGERSTAPVTSSEYRTILISIDSRSKGTIITWKINNYHDVPTICYVISFVCEHRRWRMNFLFLLLFFFFSTFSFFFFFIIPSPNSSVPSFFSPPFSTEIIVNPRRDLRCSNVNHYKPIVTKVTTRFIQ